MQQAMREEFEAWFVRNYALKINGGHYGFSLDRYESPPHQYIYDTPFHDWRVWQASRAALKVELPEKIGPHNMVGRHVLPEAAGYDDAIDDCREALQQAGIEVKQNG
ncbi:hypothetical protein ABD584_000439 [Pseudomonas aeruginosa]